MADPPSHTSNAALVIGAGMAGLACARRLVEGGWTVTVFDKGRRAGGRVASRDTPEGVFDHGAQFFTLRDPAFAEVVRAAERAGRVSRWALPGRDAPVWTGTPSMQCFPAWLAQGLDLRCSHEVLRIQRTDAGWWVAGEAHGEERFELLAATLILTVPLPQLAALISDRPWHDPEYAPSWTVMLRADAPVTMPLWPSDHPVLGSVVAEHSRPGRDGPPRITLQATAEWSLRHLEDDAQLVAPRLLRAFAEGVGVSEARLRVVSIHRWRYALASRPGDGPYWDPATRLGAAGDGWSAARVESSWCSGYHLAGQIMASS